MFIENVILDNEILFMYEGALEFFVHYPGQFEKMDKEGGLYGKQFDIWMDNSTFVEDYNYYQVNIGQLQVLRRRSVAGRYCNNDHDGNFDARWKEYIMSKVGCVPSYWRDDDRTNNFQSKKLLDCNTSQQYKLLAAYLDKNESAGLTTDEVINDIESCTEATIFTTVYKDAFENWLDNYLDIEESDIESSNFIALRIIHQSQKYLEIINSRSSSFAEMGSQVGGLIGIFLGYCMLQVALYNTDKLFQSVLTCITNII